MNRKLPELLCPAGTPEALAAAVEGGADAVYLGGTQLNARMHAGNFSNEALESAVRLAHSFGVKVYLTLNTLVGDRELETAINAAWDAAVRGVDALIVADVGAASAIHRCIPGLELHASTQMSGHNSLMGGELQRMGFSRMVLAREISKENLALTVTNCPIETELFVHGALCVCHSGQCLFSSLVGGRSGNRGECAQPCRLPYTAENGKKVFPLSLKDLSLAAHLPEIIASGVTSLKIEGRMKSPEYVLGTARIWRKLLDEGRGAEWEELRELSELFSRSGLTDGYFTGKINSGMLGIRREEDKKNSRETEAFRGLTRKLPVELAVKIRREEPIAFTVTDGEREVTVTGEPPQTANNQPLSEEAVAKSIGQLGGTPYGIGKLQIDLENGLMVPLSAIKDLRRRGMEAFVQKAESEASLRQVQKPQRLPYLPHAPQAGDASLWERTARFYCPSQITEEAKRYFSKCYLPLFSHTPAANGVVLPAVIFEKELPLLRERLKRAVAEGAEYALVGNWGHLALAREAGLKLCGDYRLNLSNGESLATAEEWGFEDSILSPELTLPGLRDLSGNSQALVYGRIPLMTVEKCVIKEVADCSVCKQGKAQITDRRRVSFPILREWEHRNIIYNSVPTGMSDKIDELERYRLRRWHFLFSTESGEEVDAVIRAYREGIPLPFPVRRMMSR